MALCLLAPLLFCLALPASQALELRAPEAGFRALGAALRIAIPADVDAAALERWRLEIDGIDVTEYVNDAGEYALTRAGDDAVFTPPRPLVPGEHELRLVEYTPEGEIIELALWTFEVRQSRRFREASYQLQGDLQSLDLAADKNQETIDRSTQSQGAAAGSFSIAGAEWRGEGRLDMLHDSSASGFGGREVDLGEFYIAGSGDTVQGSLGHQSFDNSSLVLSSFHRRGARAALDVESIGLSVSGFSARTDPVVGFGHGLGIGDSRNRAEGAVVQLQPLRASPERLTLTGTYLGGEGEEAGAGLAGLQGAALGYFVERTRARAWSLAADSQWLDQRLRLRAEYAATRLDLDDAGIGLDLGTEHDHAYRLNLGWQATARLLAGHKLQWSAELTHQRVGPAFVSLGHLGLPQDRRASVLDLYSHWRGFSLQMQGGLERDNVEHTTLLPTFRTDYQNLSLTWASLAPADRSGLAGWFDNPSFSLSGGRVRGRQRDTPAGFLGLEADNRTLQFAATADFSPGLWSWGLSYDQTRVEDYAPDQQDPRSSSLALNLYLPLGERLDLSQSLGWDRYEFDSVERTLSSNTYLSFVLLPDRLTGTFSVSMNHRRARDDSLDERTLVYDLGLNWNLLAATPARPGIDLFMSANYEDYRDDSESAFLFEPDFFPGVDSGLRHHGYQVFVGVKIAWLGGRP